MHKHTGMTFSLHESQSKCAHVDKFHIPSTTFPQLTINDLMNIDIHVVHAEQGFKNRRKCKRQLAAMHIIQNHTDSFGFIYPYCLRYVCLHPNKVNVI